ncbi:MAG TPA: ester cyclase [Anaeromyxobacteraceae bacterium]|jgi:predicted ester cyclase|nr:ester cyclase [Anaeromyxobacteraceae bacterium]
MAVDIKQAQRRLIEEAFGNGNFDVYDEVCDPTYRTHDPVAGDADLKQEKENCRMYKTAFPDLKPTILRSWVDADGDTCIAHWRMTGRHQGALMGVAPTGRTCTVEGISISHFRGGRIVEEWVQWDALGLMKQLGAGAEAGAQAGRGTGAQPEVRH